MLAFLYADLIVLPLLDVYRRYYGWKMAAYISAIFFTTMVATGLLMDLAFTALHLVPAADPHIRARREQFSLNYTFWLDLACGVLAVWLVVIARRHPAARTHCCH